MVEGSKRFSRTARSRGSSQTSSSKANRRIKAYRVVSGVKRIGGKVKRFMTSRMKAALKKAQEASVRARKRLVKAAPARWKAYRAAKQQLKAVDKRRNENASRLYNQTMGPVAKKAIAENLTKRTGLKAGDPRYDKAQKQAEKIWERYVASQKLRGSISNYLTRGKRAKLLLRENRKGK